MSGLAESLVKRAYVNFSFGIREGQRVHKCYSILQLMNNLLYSPLLLQFNTYRL